MNIVALSVPRHKKKAWNVEWFAFVQEISTLSTRPPASWEVVLSDDEHTNLQPRPRLAAFDTRSGPVYAAVASGKRQVEFITFLKQLDREIGVKVTTIHVVLPTPERQLFPS
jgi:hypothetical protein